MPDDPVAVLRRFNRSFTPRIGVLDESFLGSGRLLAAARLLFEIGLSDAGVTVQALRERLDADSGYISRLLRRLEAEGLVELHDDPDDGRRRIARLTDAGGDEWRELDRRSDEIAQGVLASLSADQAARLAEALDTADRLLRCSSITSEVVDPAGELAERALRMYFDELDRRFDGGFDAVDDSPAERESMRAPRGAFVVLVEGESLVGCGGVSRFDEETAEIKRMWLDPSVRGLGLGRRLLGELESIARNLGCRTVLLDTNDSLEVAISMYHAAGYEPCERYNANPYADHWFRKPLS